MSELLVLFAKSVAFMFAIAFPKDLSLKDFLTPKDLNNWDIGTILSAGGVTLGLGRFGGTGSKVGPSPNFKRRLGRHQFYASWPWGPTVLCPTVQGPTGVSSNGGETDFQYVPFYCGQFTGSRGQSVRRNSCRR